MKLTRSDIKPRTGNPTYAAYVDSLLGANIYRGKDIVIRCMTTSQPLIYSRPQLYTLMIVYRHSYPSPLDSNIMVSPIKSIPVRSISGLTSILGNEYWQNPDPASAASVTACTGDEDPTCSASIPSTEFINQDHLVYFNIFVFTSFC